MHRITFAFAADKQPLSLNIIFHFEINEVMRVIEGKTGHRKDVLCFILSSC